MKLHGLADTAIFTYYTKPDVHSLSKRVEDLELRLDKQDKNIILLTEKLNILLSQVQHE